MTKKAIDAALAKIAKQRDEAVLALREALDELVTLADEQRDAFDNMPESLQSSDNGQNSEARADKLEEMKDELEEAIETLESLELEVE